MAAYAQLIATVLVSRLRRTGLRTHERVLLRHYSVAEAEAVVKALTASATSVVLNIPLESGDVLRHSAAAVLIQGCTPEIELIPFVVAKTAVPQGPSWLGVQGFASRLRDNFTASCPSDRVRVLLTFDSAPVETEKTAASVELSRSIDSIASVRDHLISALGGSLPEASAKVVSEAMYWWVRQVTLNTGWLPERHTTRCERLATFGDSAVALARAGEPVGNAFPALGLVFADPDAAVPAGEAPAAFHDRLTSNNEMASLLDSARRQRLVAPLDEARTYIDFSAADTALIAALRDPGRLITDSPLTFRYVRERWREGLRCIFEVAATTVSTVGGPAGEDASWSLFRIESSSRAKPGSPPQVAELVIATPTGRAEMVLTPIRAVPTVLRHRLGARREGPKHDVRPGAPVHVEVGDGSPFSIAELNVRDSDLARGNLQSLRVAVIRGRTLVVPDDARLDVTKQAFRVDGTADTLSIRVGAREEAATIPESAAGRTPTPFSWTTTGDVGEPLSITLLPEDREPESSGNLGFPEVPVLQVVGLRATGDSSKISPFVTADGSLAATSGGERGRLAVPAHLLKLEARLVTAPDVFLEDDERSKDARTHLTAALGTPFVNWLDARRRFFAAIEAQSRARLGANTNVFTVYACSFRNDAFRELALNYITAYHALLSAAFPHVAQGRDVALVQPLLLCDRPTSGPGSFWLAPTHPLAVSALGALELGILNRVWGTRLDRESVETICGMPLLAGVVPWVDWNGRVLTARRRGPLLWREYDSESAETSDPFEDLDDVVIAAVEDRLLELAPHLDDETQTLFLDFDVGNGPGRFIVDALAHLARKHRCRFDVGIHGSGGGAVVALFDASPSMENGSVRELLRGRLRVQRLQALGSRDSHLCFRMAGVGATPADIAAVPSTRGDIHDTGFLAGLLEEPLRIAETTLDSVQYRQYVHASLGDVSTSTDDLWGGQWRTHFRALKAATQQLSVGLRWSATSASVPVYERRQVIRSANEAEYQRAFMTLHCDPAQGPQFFTGARAREANVYLVECSDRGEPTLPGQGIVAVTPRLPAFQARLQEALSRLPPDLHSELRHANVASDLLRDLNVLRSGPWVFKFLRVAARDGSHREFMAGLDNVLAMRLVYGDRSREPRSVLPVVVSLDDLFSRTHIKAPPKGKRCDDLAVFYLPKCDVDVPRVLLRIVEVKFGDNGQESATARDQVLGTHTLLRDQLPAGVWSDSPNPRHLLLARDFAWLLEEALDRLFSFDLLPHRGTTEDAWHLNRLFGRLHRGRFELTLGGVRARQFDPSLKGTAVMLDPALTGAVPAEMVRDGVQFVTVPLASIRRLITAPLPIVAEDTSAPASPAVGTPPAPVAPALSAGTISGRDEPASAIATPSLGASEVGLQAPAAETAQPPESDRAPASHRADEIKARIDGVFAGFIGNTGPVEQLKRTLRYAALSRKPYLDPIGLFGPKSTGKTELSRRIAAALGAPKLELSQATLTSADDLASAIEEVASTHGGLPVETTSHGETRLVAPPMLVFVDEVHLLRRNVQDAMLKATEPEDRVLLSTQGAIDTRHITFVIATTDVGALGLPFKTRFRRFDLSEYSLDEIVLILKDKRNSSPRIPPEATSITDGGLAVIAIAGRCVPRQALQCMIDVAEAIALGEVEPDETSIREYYRVMRGMDRLGLDRRDRKYLSELFPDKRLGIDALAIALGLDPDTVAVDIEPFLFSSRLIEKDGTRGRCLTETGRTVVGQFSHNGM